MVVLRDDLRNSIVLKYEKANFGPVPAQPLRYPKYVLVVIEIEVTLKSRFHSFDRQISALYLFP